MVMHVDTALTREAAAQAGESLYETRLKSILEPSHNGKLVAIYIPTKEYFVGESLIEAGTLAWPNGVDIAPEALYQAEDVRSAGEKNRKRMNKPRHSSA